MKRAPIIPKTVPSPAPHNPVDTPAAPMVDSLIARVSAMAKGNTITLPVCGRDVRFTLETVPADKVENSTTVWRGNERVQEFLTEDALDDLIPSFLTSGQQNPAFGRKSSDIIEVADGSRRRMTAILTSCEYRVLVGDLDDEQMDSLCKIGNDYRPTSAYERGQRYSNLLEHKYKGNVSALADAEHISRKIITRCINTARLPRELIALFSHPGELSARAGDALSKIFDEHSVKVRIHLERLTSRKKQGEKLESDYIIQQLNDVTHNPQKPPRNIEVKQHYVPGATSYYKGDKFIISLDTNKLPEEIVKKIQDLLDTLSEPSR